MRISGAWAAGEIERACFEREYSPKPPGTRPDWFKPLLFNRKLRASHDLPLTTAFLEYVQAAM